MGDVPRGRLAYALVLFSCADAATPPGAPPRRYEWTGRLDYTIDGELSLTQRYLAAGRSLHDRLLRHYAASNSEPLDVVAVRQELTALCSCVPLEKLSPVLEWGIKLYPRDLVEQAYGMRCAGVLDVNGTTLFTLQAQELVGEDVTRFTMIANRDAAMARLLSLPSDLVDCRPLHADGL